MNYYERHIGDYIQDTSHLSLLEHGVYARLLDIYYANETGVPDAMAERLVNARTAEERAAVRTILQEFFVLVTPENPMGFQLDSETEPTWKQRRCEAEITAAKRRIEAARNNGKKGGRPPKRGAKPAKKPVYSSDKTEKTQWEPSGEPNPNPSESSPSTIYHLPSTINNPPFPPDEPTTGRGENGRRSEREVERPSQAEILMALECAFVDFWQAYPRKVGKGQARKAYKAALRKPGVTPQRILEAVRSQRFDEREKFIPHPATWLNGERWADEVSHGDPVLRAAGLNDDGTLADAADDPDWALLTKGTA